jgi:hypothetical protein
MNDNDERILFNIAMTIIRYQRITSRKKQLMKRRINNVDFYFHNNVRTINRAKRHKFSIR